ncbi:GGDEF domain-containing protein [Nakamurella alba]|uniref:GGDEF domain-containing protein n=1 Tax=Nakamurella alba TaxID=2665158 RepID=UPI0018AB4AE8|nr:GGDEF domain-containing protein [Nakamurella alba]
MNNSTGRQASGPVPANPFAPALLLPTRGFDAVSEQVVGYLRSVTPMKQWAVTRFAHGTETILTASPELDGFGVAPGDDFPLDKAMCHRMSSGDGPRIAPDTRAVRVYDEAYRYAADQGMTINAYVGTPIVRPNGEVFGSICGLDPETKDDSLRDLEPLLDLLSSMLSAVLDADSSATEAARDLEQARHDADTDALTGLLNRRGWERFIEHEEARFRRFGDPASVVMIDLDRLKYVNDTQGHDAGDRYIQRTADALRATTRDSDVVARLGGDEFGIIAVGAGQERTREMIARISQAFEDAGVAGSIGYAPFTVVAGFPGAQRTADERMYEAKRRRRELLAEHVS